MQLIDRSFTESDVREWSSEARANPSDVRVASVTFEEFVKILGRTNRDCVKQNELKGTDLSSPTPYPSTNTQVHSRCLSPPPFLCRVVFQHFFFRVTLHLSLLPFESTVCDTVFMIYMTCCCPPPPLVLVSQLFLGWWIGIARAFSAPKMWWSLWLLRECS